MTYGFEERDYSLDKFEDSFTPEKPLLDLSGFRPTTPLVSAIRALGSPTAQAGYRGIASGLSLGLEVISDDDEVKDQTIFDYIVDGAAERAAKMRIDNEDFAKKQGLGGGIAYGLTYGLSGFFGTFGNPALYGQGLASARTKSELAAGVDPATAQKIGAIEGVTGAIGSVIPFFGKTLVQRLGFGAAANIIPGIGQRAAEAAVFGDRYASRAPEVFDPVAITVDALLGGSFGYLAGIADKPSSIPDQDINDALDLNVKVKQADSAPGMPNETSFAIHNKIMDEMVAARREYRQPDFRALADAEFKDSPEQIRQMQEALDEIEAWRGDDGEVKMMPSEVAEARSQIEGVDVSIKEGTSFLSAKSEVGQVGGNVKDGELRISFAEIEEAARGKGEGVKLYSALIKNALNSGLRVFSDKAVSADAVRVYESLQRKGFEVKDLSAGRLEDGAAYGAKDGPAFEVVSAPSRADTIAIENQKAIQASIPDYAAIAKRTEATKSMTLDNYLEEAKTTLDPESTVTIDGKPVKVADLLEDDPIATQEATGMKKLVECMLNVR